MPTLTDARFDALRALVPSAPPHTNDMLMQYLRDNGATGNTLGDLWVSFFIAQGGTPGIHRNDMIREFLTAEGFTQNHLNDAWLAFWLSGGVPSGGGGGGFVSFRSAGTRYQSPRDGVGPFALDKPAGYQAGDMLIVSQVGTFFSGTHPVENPGPWTMFANTSEHKFGWRFATGDANDDYTVNTVGATSAHTAVMMAFDLSSGPYISAVIDAGGTLLANDSSFTTAYPTPGFSEYPNPESITICHWFKTTNVNISASGVVDNLDAVVAALASTQDSGVVAPEAFDGLGGNPGGARSSWVGTSWWITEVNPALAISFPSADQTESPESSGFEVMSIYGFRMRLSIF